MQPSGNINDFLERQKIYDEMKKDKLERKINKSTIEKNENYKKFNDRGRVQKELGSIYCKWVNFEIYGYK